MTHGSLFSGIGGFDLAAQWMGWDNLFHCEWNEFGQKVLKHYWPDAELFTDITKSDFKKYANKIDVLSGGFPCQPYSLAGKRKGKDDERHLWPEMLRAIREIRPRWVVGENVFGLVNWSGGLVFHEVQSDLEAQGYEVFPYVLPAAGVQNCPHRRDRVWFVAYATGNGHKNGCEETRREEQCSEQWRMQQFEGMGGERTTPNPNRNGHESGRFAENRPTEAASQRDEQERQRIWTDDRRTGKQGDATNSDSQVLEYRNGKGETIGRTIKKERIKSFNSPGEWETFPTVSPICTRDDGIPNRLDGITFSKWRNESIKAAGNAVVPQVVFQIFKAIEQMTNPQTQ